MWSVKHQFQGCKLDIFVKFIDVSWNEAFREFRWTFVDFSLCAATHYCAASAGANIRTVKTQSRAVSRSSNAGDHLELRVAAPVLKSFRRRVLMKHIDARLVC